MRTDIEQVARTLLSFLRYRGTGKTFLLQHGLFAAAEDRTMAVGSNLADTNTERPAQRNRIRLASMDSIDLLRGFQGAIALTPLALERLLDELLGEIDTLKHEIVKHREVRDMPAKYTAIKKSVKAACKKAGGSEKTCDVKGKRIGAATYNKQRKPGQKPVTRKTR